MTTGWKERVEGAQGTDGGGAVCEVGGEPRSRQERELPEGGVADSGAAEKGSVPGSDRWIGQPGACG